MAIHLSRVKKRKLLYIDSNTHFSKLLRKIDEHYGCDLLKHNKESKVGLGLSVKSWNARDTAKWAQRVEEVDDPGEEHEDYVEMVLSIDTPEKWDWCLGVTRQGLNIRELKGAQNGTRSLGVEMWFIDEDGDQLEVGMQSR